MGDLKKKGRKEPRNSQTSLCEGSLVGQIHLASDPRLCLDVGGFNNGDPVQVGLCTSSTRFVMNSDDTAQIRLASDLTKCLDVAGGIKSHLAARCPSITHFCDTRSRAGSVLQATARGFRSGIVKLRPLNLAVHATSPRVDVRAYVLTCAFCAIKVNGNMQFLFPDGGVGQIRR